MKKDEDTFSKLSSLSLIMGAAVNIIVYILRGNAKKAIEEGSDPADVHGAMADAFRSAASTFEQAATFHQSKADAKTSTQSKSEVEIPYD